VTYSASECARTCFAFWFSHRAALGICARMMCAVSMPDSTGAKLPLTFQQAPNRFENVCDNSVKALTKWGGPHARQPAALPGSRRLPVSTPRQKMGGWCTISARPVEPSPPHWELASRRLPTAMGSQDVAEGIYRHMDKINLVFLPLVER
jgi:hypothetical protein